MVERKSKINSLKQTSYIRSSSNRTSPISSSNRTSPISSSNRTSPISSSNRTSPISSSNRTSLIQKIPNPLLFNNLSFLPKKQSTLIQIPNPLFVKQLSIPIATLNKINDYIIKTNQDLNIRIDEEKDKKERIRNYINDVENNKDEIIHSINKIKKDSRLLMLIKLLQEYYKYEEITEKSLEIINKTKEQIRQELGINSTVVLDMVTKYSY